MINAYEVNLSMLQDAQQSAVTASSSLNGIPDKINSVVSLAANVDVDISFLSNSNYSENISFISGYGSKLSEIISMTNQKDVIREYIQNGDMSSIVAMVNSGEISMQTLIDYGVDFMNDIAMYGDINSYNRGYAIIGNHDKLSRHTYANVEDALLAMGFSNEVVYSLSDSYCKYLINNDLMYTKEGVVAMATSFTGLLSMFGLELGYSHTENDRSYHGFYFSNGEENAKILGSIDCCNYTDWLARCVGIDIAGYGATSKHNYVIDGYTPKGEILAGYEDDYYKKAEGGDYLSRNTSQSGHVMMIIANDGNGYYFAENGNVSEINYMTYEQLANQGYKVTNMDALYRNTANTSDGEVIYLNEEGGLAKNYGESIKVQKTEVFARPEWFYNQKNINLTAEEYESLCRQYDERNQNPNYTHEEFEPLPDKNDNVVPEIIPDNNENNGINLDNKETEIVNPDNTPNDTNKDNIAVNLGNQESEKPNDTTIDSDNSNESNKTGVSDDSAQTKPNYSGSSSVTKPSYSRPSYSGSSDSSNDDYYDSSSSDTSPDYSAPSVTPTPSEPVNILPVNKFTESLPELYSGTLGTMEISQNGVSYEVLNIDASTYADYIEKLLLDGYKMTAPGVFTKGNYQVIATINESGVDMFINLKTIDSVQKL